MPEGETVEVPNEGIGPIAAKQIQMIEQATAEMAARYAR